MVHDQPNKSFSLLGKWPIFIEKTNKMLVIACNTATAVALEEIKAALPIPVVGVILPGARAAVKVTKITKLVS